MADCDGGSFSGNNETVTTYKGAKLTFRGKRIREAMVESLSAAGLAKATDLVVSGCSAGGLATFLHTDQWCDALAKVNPHAKCVGMPDSGFFLDYQSPKVPSDEDNLGTTVPGNYHNGLKWVFDFMNTTAGVNQACIDAYPQDQHYRCQFAEHSAKYLHTPMFPLQSEYDAWQTGHVLAPGDDVNTMGKNITLRMSVDLLKPHPERYATIVSHGSALDASASYNGTALVLPFSPSCLCHCSPACAVLVLSSVRCVCVCVQWRIPGLLSPSLRLVGVNPHRRRPRGKRLPEVVRWHWHQGLKEGVGPRQAVPLRSMLQAQRRGIVRLRWSARPRFHPLFQCATAGHRRCVLEKALTSRVLLGHTLPQLLSRGHSSF